jgi:hypothetical protein
MDAGFKTQFVEHAAEIGVDTAVVPRNPEVAGFRVVEHRPA